MTLYKLDRRGHAEALPEGADTVRIQSLLPNTA
jgi:hypothetical protein